VVNELRGAILIVLLAPLSGGLGGVRHTLSIAVSLAGFLPRAARLPIRTSFPRSGRRGPRASDGLRADRRLCRSTSKGRAIRASRCALTRTTLDPRDLCSYRGQSRSCR